MRREIMVPAIFGIIAFVITLWNPQTGWFVRGIILGETGSVNELAVENASLRATLEESQYLDEITHPDSSSYVLAMVYARYPGNAKSELVIAAGKRNGIKEGQPVVIFPNTKNPLIPILVGKIARVTQDSASVMTIFDASWKSAVYIGKAKKDALLIGGSNPQLTLIEKKGIGIQEGYTVRNASRDLPYGLMIGEVANVGLSSDQLYEEASLHFVYAVGDLRAVYVDTAFQNISVAP